jgi:DNA-binding NarL/FixJ family response regulator
MSETISVLLADDHPVVRHGLRQVIELDRQLRVVAEAGDGGEALRLLRELRPRVALLDIDMPGLDGVAVARAARDERLPAALVFLTVYREERFFNHALDLGVRGYVLKDSAVADIVSGIKAVAAGQYFTSPAMTAHLVARANRTPPRAAPPQAAGLAGLTATERRVLRLIAEYKTSKEIAADLCISFRTVNTHRANICQKLGLHGNHALMKFALDHLPEL